MCIPTHNAHTHTLKFNLLKFWLITDLQRYFMCCDYFLSLSDLTFCFFFISQIFSRNFNFVCGSVQVYGSFRGNLYMRYKEMTNGCFFTYGWVTPTRCIRIISNTNWHCHSNSPSTLISLIIPRRVLSHLPLHPEEWVPQYGWTLKLPCHTFRDSVHVKCLEHTEPHRQK